MWGDCWAERSSAHRRLLTVDFSGEVIGERLDAEGLREMRGCVLRLVHILASARLTVADVRSIIALLRSCRDARVLIDVVQMLLGWLTPVAPTP
eukprot:4406790-Pleurochrysis_carterae.AAC.1